MNNKHKKIPFPQLQSSNGQLQLFNGTKYLLDLTILNKKLYSQISPLIFTSDSKISQTSIDTSQDSQQIPKITRFFSLSEAFKLGASQNSQLIFEFFNLIDTVNWEEISGISLSILNFSFIVHPFYSSLKNLHLHKNHIVNIEAIAFLNAPYLQQLDLAQNHICTTKGLEKTLFTQLNSLKILKNHIRTKDLGRIKITQQHFKFEYELRENILQCTKLQNKKLTNINNHFNGTWLVLIASPYNSLLLAQSKNVGRILKFPWTLK